MNVLFVLIGFELLYWRYGFEGIAFTRKGYISHILSA